MLDDDTVTWQLAVMLRTLDIALSLDHMAKLEEEGYDFDMLNADVVDALIEQQDELSTEIDERANALANAQNVVFMEEAYIEELQEDLTAFTDRLVEFTS